jgi:Sugar phosphate isomerases/epimerases
MILGMIENWSEEGFKKVADYGLGAVEFCYNIGNDPAKLWEQRADVKQRSAARNVKVGAVGRWGTDKFAPDSGALIEEELAGSKALVDFCAEVGCPVFNTGVNYVESLSFLDNCNLAVDWLGGLLDYAAPKGVKIATYNCSWNNFVRTPRAWELVHGKLPALGLKYDSSHTINSGSGDYLGEIAQWGARIYHVHIKGTINIGGKHIDDPPAGLDMIDWRQELGLLYAAKYDAMLSIEPHSAIWKGDLGDWGVRKTIEYIGGLICG